MATILWAPSPGSRWIPNAIALIQRARQASNLHICVTLARAPAAKLRTTVPAAEVESVRAVMQAFVARIPNVALGDGDAWSVVVLTAACASAIPAE